MRKPATTKKTSPAVKAPHQSPQTTRATQSTSKAKSASHASTTTLRDTKQSRLITLLQTKPGATMAQMVKTTGWQSHTVRGTISGVLRKKLGFQVSNSPKGDSSVRLYRITGRRVSA